MKRIVSAIAIMLLTVGSASAAWLTTQSDGTVSNFPVSKVGANVTFAPKVSANVTVGYTEDSTSGNYYVLSTYHSTGTKTYASSSNESRIFMAEQATKAEPSQTGGAVTWTGWTAVK